MIDTDAVAGERVSRIPDLGGHMNDVIDILERMGTDAGLRDAPRQELEQALAAEPIDGAVLAAMLSGDRVELLRLMGAGAQFSVIMPVEEEETPADGEEGEELPPDRDGNV
jgi:hypothetical protein